MALISRNPRALTIIGQISIFMLIFCFTGCIAGSCLSYGHSCWGAHGKRSDVQDASALRFLTSKALLSESPQNGIASSSKAQWLLPRLITGQPILPLMDKYRIRWSSFPKDRAYIPPKWEHDATLMSDENVEPIRNLINDENRYNEKKFNNEQGKVNEKSENAAEVLLVSPDEYDKPINDLPKLDVFKFLSERNENRK